MLVVSSFCFLIFGERKLHRDRESKRVRESETKSINKIKIGVQQKMAWQLEIKTV